MTRRDATKLIGTRVQAWTSANGVYVGTLVSVIAGAKWRGLVQIDGVIAPAHHFEFGEVVRRGFRPGEEIEVGGVNISPTDATGSDYLSALEGNVVRLNTLCASAPADSKNTWAVKATAAANEVIIRAEKRRLETGEWKLDTRTVQIQPEVV